ncbi:SusC/RagA family TonB-linked outer membrane protein [Ferruginibacter sp. SUN002]|uniref:SusC/RagA family TonB-linked outer membrane protein n=1 Tax=Ferruginibacter sp. SUN002 TaxID=2937789 RepID=UPI003D35C3F3
MRKSMRKFIGIFSGTFALLLLSTVALAQNVVTGKVSDLKDGSPASGVTVTVKGTNVATQTASDGTYTISSPTANPTLVFTSTEFGRQEVKSNGGKANVSLTKAVQNLGEVVIIGYGTVKKKDLTGAITNVTAKDFNKGQNSTAEQLIAGKVAGVAVTSNSGAPGSGSTIRIRGGASLNASNNPLIVIDGVPLADGGGGVSGSPSALALINPNDIESFSVLKDASATAIYGSRASNGVIIITTRKGKKGKAVFNFSSQMGVYTLPNKVEVMTGDQVRSYVTANGKSSDIALLGTANTDWQDLIYQTALSTDNNFSVSGAAGKMPYRISVGYLNQEGVLKTGKLERYTGSFNINPKFFNNHLSVDLNFKGSLSHSSYANEGAIGSAVYFDPTQPVYSGNARYGGYWQWLDGASEKGLRDLATRNPVGILNQNSNIGTSRRSIGNIQVDYKFHFLPDLRANFNFGYDVGHGFGGTFASDSAATSYRRYKDPNGKFHGGSIGQYAGRNYNTVLESYLAYGKDFGKQGTRLDLMAGTSYQQFLNYNYSFQDKTLDGTVVSSPLFDVDRPRARLISYFSRLTYNYLGKYILTASVRRDGSSKFRPENRWGTFPSAAFAWRAKNESFLKNSKTFSDLKVRVGYGITGQQDGIGYYDTEPLYTIGNGQALYQFGYNIDGSPRFDTIYRPSGYYANRKWEQTATTNVGVDFGFLNNRITGSIDYYFKETKDLLNTIDVTAGNFTNKVTANVGTLENQGVELTINTQPVRNKKITWDLGFNVTYNQNKITKLTINENPNFVGNQFGSTGGFNTIQINSVGYNRAAFYAFQQVYDENGKAIEGLYVDRNRDGTINEKDLYHYKAPDANVFAGLSTGVTIGKINAGFVMRGSFGNYMYNGLQSGAGIKNTVISPLGYLQNGNPSLLETNFTGAGDKFSRSDYFIQNASFVKMDNIYFGYNVGKVFKSNANLRLNAAVQNVFIITKYDGLDPEINGGIDNNIYPRPRTFTVGVNLDF